MNQFVGKKPDGTPFLALVLEPGNLHKLQAGQPIALRVQDLFPDGIPKRLELMIDFSETPVADAREFAKEADVSLDERTAVSQSKKPHCPECKSTIEQLGAWRNDSPVALVFCPTCGCVLGTLPGETFKRG
jgi:hypothetical protein